MCVHLVLLAKGTAFDIASDEGSESGPPELGGDQLASFQEAGMSGRFVIMAACEDGVAKGVVHGDVDTSFVREDFCFNLPVSESGLKGERDIFVHRLKSLEDEGVTRGRRLNAVGEGSVNQVNKEGRWKEGDISVVRVIRGEEVRTAGKGVGSSKELSGDVDHF